MKFSLGTFSRDGSDKFAAICFDERVIALREVHGQAVRGGATWAEGASVLDLLQSWDRHLPQLLALAQELGAQPDAGVAMSSLRVHPPVDLPRQVLCTGANYRKHVVDLTLDMGVGPEGLQGEALRQWAEDMMDERAAKGEPYVFPKLPSAITGAFDPVVLPATTQKSDWELELAVIIGRPARNVRREEALDYVAGYSIVNDVSARDLIARTDYKMLGTDWLRSKSPPSFMPFGPVLVPACFVDDPQDLRITLKLNGQTMQDETSADMLFDVARQIEYISSHVQLWPGDLIATGSPAGNGTHYNRFLRDGDVMDAEIEGLGRQRNACIAEPGAH
ncbi:fumarylacetoacetate hydrolase family protein [Variovorax sp. YR216]|uniref:fumarylacetoacetate hydrolase family protein n=1 Tax=Variovorax sp. YR216 TaxID=1882828 RepID=UPI00089CDF19|nr:fumarylacetoacetate hydrolase family protein [Variovorax sp. YR216]SEB25098.1 2-keto-4-pentenoate hydratase/2-oxohepta-3-ene-1,7-dioic acid hydratase (catechol pathway) [Variovorax sp. YR216]